MMVGPAKLRKVAESADKVRYPGRDQVERAVRVVVERTASGWARSYGERQMVRLVGYHTLWHALREEGEANPRRAIVERDLMARRSSYTAEEDFIEIFGLSVAEVSRSELLRALAIRG